MTKKLFVFLCVFSIIFSSAPVLYAADAVNKDEKKSDAAGATVSAQALPGGEDACTQANDDAKAAANPVLWYALGCLTLIIAPIVGMFAAPNPGAQKLMGKSAEYTAEYTKCYQEKGKSEQAGAAFWGCATSSAIIVVAGAIYVIVVIYIVKAAAEGVATGVSKGCADNVNASCNSFGLADKLLPKAAAFPIPIMP